MYRCAEVCPEGFACVLDIDFRVSQPTGSRRRLSGPNFVGTCKKTCSLNVSADLSTGEIITSNLGRFNDTVLSLHPTTCSNLLLSFI